MSKKLSLIKKALISDGILPYDKGTLRILSGDCVNSKWIASWLSKGYNACQCGFKCKVRIEISQNGHHAYRYIVDKNELYKLIKIN